MLNRRRIMQGGLAAAGSLSVSRRSCARPGQAGRQDPLQRGRPLGAVRAELRRLTKGYFKDAGLDVR